MSRRMVGGSAPSEAVSTSANVGCTPARRKECAEQERRLEPSAVAALTALGGRDAAVRETERRACGAVDSDLRRALVGSRGGRVVRQRRHTAG